MQSFIVLGIIPGTNIQVNFMFWVYVALGILSVPVLARLVHKRYTLTAYLTARKINRFIRQYQFQVPA